MTTTPSLRRTFRRTAAAAAGLVMTATTFGAISTPAAADERVCRGTLGAVTVDNLRVPEGATCVLLGTRVKGTVKIEDDAVLRANAIRVVGNIQAEDHRRVIVQRSIVGGSIQLDDGGRSGERSATLTSNRVKGDIQLFDNDGSQVVTANRIDGNLQCKENTPAPTGGRNVVGGNKEDQCRRL